MFVSFVGGPAIRHSEFGVPLCFRCVQDSHTSLLHRRSDSGCVGGLAIIIDADYPGGRCPGFRHACDLIRARLGHSRLASVHWFSREQEVPEPTLQFRSGAPSQFPNFTDRKSPGIGVDADLAWFMFLHRRNVCCLNPVVRFQQVTEPLHARITGI